MVNHGLEYPAYPIPEAGTCSVEEDLCFKQPCGANSAKDCLLGTSFHGSLGRVGSSEVKVREARSLQSGWVFEFGFPEML